MMEPIYREGEKFVPLGSAQRRLGLTEAEVRYLITHGRLAHHFNGDALYVRESDLETLASKSAKALAGYLPPTDPQAIAARIPR